MARRSTISRASTPSGSAAEAPPTTEISPADRAIVQDTLAAIGEKLGFPEAPLLLPSFLSFYAWESARLPAPSSPTALRQYVRAFAFLRLCHKKPRGAFTDGFKTAVLQKAEAAIKEWMKSTQEEPGRATEGDSKTPRAVKTPAAASSKSYALAALKSIGIDNPADSAGTDNLADKTDLTRQMRWCPRTEEAAVGAEKPARPICNLYSMKSQISKL